MPTFRRLLALEAVGFALASVVHSGALVDVSVDPGASTAEGVIAAMLLAGAVVAWVRTRQMGHSLFDKETEALIGGAGHVRASLRITCLPPRTTGTQAAATRL